MSRTGVLNSIKDMATNNGILAPDLDIIQTEIDKLEDQNNLKEVIEESVEEKKEEINWKKQNQKNLKINYF